MQVRLPGKDDALRRVLKEVGEPVRRDRDCECLPDTQALTFLPNTTSTARPASGGFPSLTRTGWSTSRKQVMAGLPGTKCSETV